VVQAGYALLALSLVLALLGEWLAFPTWYAVIPALATPLLHRSRANALRTSRLSAHVSWQSNTVLGTLAAVAASMLVLGPLLFLGLPVLAWALALIGLWMAWRIARGVHALLTDQPLVTRSGRDE
jgi:uncharacterized membrane protein